MAGVVQSYFTTASGSIYTGASAWETENGSIKQGSTGSERNYYGMMLFDFAAIRSMLDTHFARSITFVLNSNGANTADVTLYIGNGSLSSVARPVPATGTEGRTIEGASSQAKIVIDDTSPDWSDWVAALTTANCLYINCGDDSENYWAGFGANYAREPYITIEWVVRSSAPTKPSLNLVSTIETDSYRFTWGAASAPGYTPEQLRYELSTSYDGGNTWSAASITRPGATSYVVGYREIVAPNNWRYYNPNCKVRIRAVAPNNVDGEYAESNLFLITYPGGVIGYPGFTISPAAFYPGTRVSVTFTRPEIHLETEETLISYFLTVKVGDTFIPFIGTSAPLTDDTTTTLFVLSPGSPVDEDGKVEISAMCVLDGETSNAGNPTVMDLDSVRWDQPVLEVVETERETTAAEFVWRISDLGREYSAATIGTILGMEYSMDDGSTWSEVDTLTISDTDNISGIARISGLVDNEPYTVKLRATTTNPTPSIATVVIVTRSIAGSPVTVSVLPFFPAAYIFRTADGEHTGLAAKNLILNADDYSGAIDEDGRIYIENGKADLPVAGSNSAGWKWHKYEDGTAIAWRDLGTVNRSFNTTDSTWPSGWRHPSSAISCTFPSGLFVAEPTHIDAVLGNGTKRGRMYNVYTANETKDDCDIWVWVYGSATETLAINLRVMVVGRWK